MIKRLSTKTIIGLFKRETGERTMVNRSAKRDILSGDTQNMSSESAELSGERGAQSMPVDNHDGQYVQNEDPFMRRFYKRGMKAWKRNLLKAKEYLTIFIAFTLLFFSKDFTRDEKMTMLFRMRRWKADELTEHRKQKVNDEIFRFHRQQARLVQKQIIDKLTDLRMCYYITKNEKIYIKKRISFSHVDVSPNAYIFYIHRVPFGVRVTDIMKQETTDELMACVQKQIYTKLDFDGPRIVVEVASTFNIPNFCGFIDKQIPDHHPPLAFFAGAGVNGAPVIRNLAEAPHMIIAGPSGRGKSNMQNSIICTFIRRNSADAVKFVLFDLKDGVEFSFFKQLPHLFAMQSGEWESDGIIESPDDVIKALECLLRECKRRNNLFKKMGVKNITEYNHRKIKNRMPYIVGCFDEYATAYSMTDSAELERILSVIANISRAAGIHFILGTQYPKAEILNTRISINFTWRIGFDMPMPASQAVFGSSAAVGLSPTGRAVFQTDKLTQIQTPYITPTTIEDIVKESVTGVHSKQELFNVDAYDILKWAINNNNGKLDQESVYSQFRERIEREAIRQLLRNMEDNFFEVNGANYKVVSASGSLSRRMILDEEGGMSDDNPANGQRPANDYDENSPESDISTVTRDTSPHHTCVHCSAQTLTDPCEYCGVYAEDQPEEMDYAS